MSPDSVRIASYRSPYHQEFGLTGIETGEIIMGVSEANGAKAVICIDTLASHSVERLCATIQISDTGIHPGAGVGNRRLPINRILLGCP